MVWLRWSGLGLLLLGACQTSEVPLWRHLYLRAESSPVLSEKCPTDTLPWAVSVALRQEPLTGQVEWLSGHRYALTMVIEQLPIRLIILERPWDDPNFFPLESGEAAQLWKEKFREWLLSDFLPFIAPYPQLRYVAFGRGWTQAPLTPQEWKALLDTLRSQDSTLQWGIAAGTPDSLPAIAAWDFLGIDYQHFYPAHRHRSYHARWEATGKPLFLLYPNLFEPDTSAALRARRKGWTSPPVALIAYQESDTLSCP